MSETPTKLFSPKQILCAYLKESGRIIYAGKPEAIILGTGWICICVGLWVANPWTNTFAVGAYEYLRNLPMPEWLWGLLVFLAGICKLGLLGLNSEYYGQRTKWTLGIGALLNFGMCLVWMNLAIILLTANTSGIAFWFFAAVFLASLWAGTRRARQFLDGG